MNNGKKLEKLVRLIQESLKDFPNTEIFSNYKIENNSGRKREIDVLLKTTINNFDLIIAIECKDYKKSVSVDKIEAFNSKCKRIKGISKKIFVASNGYQADAIEAANDFEIELYNLNEIDNQKIINWFPFVQLKDNYLLKQPYRIFIDKSEEDLITTKEEDELIIYFYDKTPPMMLTGLLWNGIVFEKQRELKSKLLYYFMKYNKNLNYQTIFPFKVELSGAYLKGKNGKKVNLLRVDSYVIGWLEEIPVNIIEARSYKKIEERTDANIVTVDIDKNEVANFVFTKEKGVKIFHTNANGQVSRMATLFEYDPQTDKFTDLRKNKNEG
jgi:hypothetical protein